MRPETAPVVADLCRRLDGLPLAIELAAARIRALPLAEVASRLQGRFGLLTGGGRTAVPRQQTLRATVDWSYGLLGERERLLLDGLSVFAGGWTLQAAEQVCSGDGIGEEEVLDLLTGLVDQSMVIRAAEDGRFRMLETIQDYARARLEESGQAAQTRRRHVAYYLARADRVDPQARTPGSWTWIGGLEPEGGNLLAALDWALQDGDTERALGLAGPLGWYWLMGNQEECRRWLGRLLAVAPASRTGHRARALRAYALVQGFHQPQEAERAARESLSIAEELGDTWGQAIAKLLVVLGAAQRGALSAAARLLDEAEATLHDHAAARRSPGGCAWPSPASSATWLPRSRRASGVCNASGSLGTRGGPRGCWPSWPSRPAGQATSPGRHAATGRRCRWRVSMGMPRPIAGCLEGLAGVAAATGEAEHAARLLGAAADIRERAGVPLLQAERADAEQAAAMARGALGGEGFARAHQQGRMLDVDRMLNHPVV